MPLQYTTDFNLFNVASLPEWPLVGPACIHCNKSFHKVRSFPTTNLLFLLSSLWFQVWCLCEEASVCKSWINFWMPGSACQELWFCSTCCFPVWELWLFDSLRLPVEIGHQLLNFLFSVWIQLWNQIPSILPTSSIGRMSSTFGSVYTVGFCGLFW